MLVMDCKIIVNNTIVNCMMKHNINAVHVRGELISVNIQCILNLQASSTGICIQP